MLEEFLGQDVVAPIYNKGWVDVMVDVDRDTGGKALNDRLKGKRSGGLPWSVILDADGKEIVSSNAEPKGGNIGGPVSPEECAWLVEMLKRSSGEKVTEAELKVVATELEAYSKPRRRRRR
ncbi:MAG: hypothetical protein ACI8UD_001041 [Planctomycetota bacterium]